MRKKVKFSSQMNKQVLEELRAYSKKSKCSISTLLTEAVRDLLKKKNKKLQFRRAKANALIAFDQDLKRLVE